MKRSKHTLSHYRMATTDMGKLVPIGCVPVLPGDTVQHHTSALVRVSPLNTPVMHPVNVRIHHFFVPNRISWEGWEDFITGGEDGLPLPIPKLTTTDDKKTVLTYLGLPPIAGTDVSALPVRAFNQIFNEYYRDQDLVPERAIDDITVPNCAWEKDYFSTARPWTQKGPEVGIPLAGEAPIKGIGYSSNVGVQTDQTVNETGGNQVTYPAAAKMDILASGFINTQPPPNQDAPLIYADLSQAAAANVNDFRAAFSLQRYQEARARYGSRFTEYLRYLGVTPSDARLQRPEFLGGGTSRLNFSEVLQTTPNVLDGTPGEQGVGDLYGHGIAGLRGNRYRKFFEEHGYIISCMSVRPKALYMNGIQREWLKTTKEDYYQKELTNLGQQEVYQAELYAENDRDIFGFQDRYHEYRSHPSQIGQDFRDTLNAWHLGRELQPDVTLNEAFVNCDPSKRIFQITDDTIDSLWCMINHHIVARRLVPKRSNPRIL
ncbi:major capsid protein [Microviridae sp.]|nr:major capsid protein [Microviridae sp.]